MINNNTHSRLRTILLIGAYPQPPPSVPTFVTIDDAYYEWYEETFQKRLNRKMVLPVQHALQGHPEAGKLWEKHITSILTSPEFGFKSTTHDKSIYHATWNGEKVLLLRQVDDFALACLKESTAIDLYDKLGKRLKLPSEEEIPFKYIGLLEDFNASK